MDDWVFSVLALSGTIAMAVWALMAEKKAVPKMFPEQRAQRRKEQKQAAASFEYGPLQREIVCPHCQTKGNVHTKSVKQKKGVSGGKATAAPLTGGISMLATGLSRKKANTQAHCSNCNITWYFDCYVSVEDLSIDAANLNS